MQKYVESGSLPYSLRVLCWRSQAYRKKKHDIYENNFF
jgi:hypothetical protein